MAAYTIKLTVTEEQDNAIKELYIEKGWTRTELGGRKRKRMSVGPKTSTSTVQRDKSPEDPVSQSDRSEDPSVDDCPHCFLHPCVTAHFHLWLGDGQPPCEENSVIRKDKYSKYWKVMGNLGGWNDPRYIAKKGDMEEGEWVLTHRREVMPFCVLKCVRDLYPNPKGQQYMGHKWE